jgi:hypothetical protein
MARGWYAGALVVALAAGALWAFELPGVSAPAQGDKPAVEPPPAVTSEQPALRPPDSDTVAGTAERLELARVPIVKPEAPAGEAPAPVAAGIAWRYLGSIIEPTRKVALVSINGAQRMLAEGRTIEQEGHTFKVVEVHPDSIVVEDNGQRLVLQKETRSGPLVAWVSPGAGGGVVDGMNGVVSGVSAAQAANGQIVGRGIDPGEAERMREEIHARRAGRAGAAGTTGAKSPIKPGAAPVPMSKPGRTLRGVGRATSEAAGETAGDATALDGAGAKGPMP